MLKRIISLSIGLLLAILLIIGYNYLKDPAQWPVKTVQVDGRLTYVEPKHLQKAINPYVVRSFFWVDVSTLQQAILQDPWIAAVSVKRAWPDKVMVQVEEHKPYLRWGEDSILSEKGVLFTPKAMPEVLLPQLDGPDVLLTTVVEMYQTLTRLLSPYDVSIVQLSVNDRRAWRAKLSNGMQVEMGSHEPLERFQRFVESAPFNLGGTINAQYVDLRYTNGFVIAKGAPHGETN